MIWIIWHIFILIDAKAHWYIIEVLGKDPTPDNKLVTWSKIGVVAARVVAYCALSWWLAPHAKIEQVCFVLGALFSHLLFFPLVLNAFRGKPAHYLGKGPVDRILALTEPLFRWLSLLILTVAAIYSYYNPDLL